MTDDRPVSEWENLRDQRLRKDNFECVNCEEARGLEVHHVVPVSQGGTNQLSNLITLCQECHGKAHHTSPQNSRTDSKDDDARWIPTLDQIQLLLEATNHPLEHAIIVIFGKTGIGVGELCNLNLTDIYLADSDVSSMLNEHRTWVVEGRPAIRIGANTGETPYPQRRERSAQSIVPLDEESCYVLKRWLAISPDPIAREYPLFMSTADKWGHRITQWMIQEIFKGQAEVIDHGPGQSQKITPQKIRHFFDDRCRVRPAVKDYILGRHSEPPMPFDQLCKHYEETIYSLL